MPRPVASTRCFHILSTCRQRGRSCSYLLKTAEIPWQGCSGCHKPSAVTRQIHPRRRQLHPPTGPAATAFVITLKAARANCRGAETGMAEMGNRDLQRADADAVQRGSCKTRELMIYHRASPYHSVRTRSARPGSQPRSVQPHSDAAKEEFGACGGRSKSLPDGRGRADTNPRRLLTEKSFWFSSCRALPGLPSQKSGS